MWRWWKVVVVVALVTSVTSCKEPKTPAKQPSAPSKSRLPQIPQVMKLKDGLTEAVTLRTKAERALIDGRTAFGLKLLRRVEHQLAEDPALLKAMVRALSRMKIAPKSQVKGAPEIDETLIYLERFCLLHRCALLKSDPIVRRLLANNAKFSSWLAKRTHTYKGHGQTLRAIRNKRGDARGLLQRLFGLSFKTALWVNLDGDQEPELVVQLNDWPSVIYLLDFRRGQIRRRYLTHTRGGAVATLSLRRFELKASKDVLLVRYQGFHSEYDGTRFALFFGHLAGPVRIGCLVTSWYREDPSGGVRSKPPAETSPLVGCERGNRYQLASRGMTAEFILAALEPGGVRTLLVDMYPGGRHNAATHEPVQYNRPQTYVFDISAKLKKIRYNAILSTARHRLALETFKLAATAHLSKRGTMLHRAWNLAPSDLQLGMAYVKHLASRKSPVLCAAATRLRAVAGTPMKSVLKRMQDVLATCDGR